MSKDQYKILNSQVDYQNPFFNVRHEKLIKQNGDSADYYIVSPGASVMMVALTANNEILLIRQFRYTTKVESIELPAGRTDGEDALTAAQRELHEETGYVASEWQHIGHLQSGKGLSDEYTDVYIAKNLTHTNHNKEHEEGISRIYKVPLDDIDEFVHSNKITDMQTIGCLYLAKLFITKQNTQQTGA